ncbi:hypothetical protein ACN47E_009452 [Coniothyrium glycines]
MKNRPAGGSTSVLLTCLSTLLAVLPADAASNFDVPWSDKKFGPDGPWQAVSVAVGGDNSDVNIGSQNTTNLQLYPGGTYNSWTYRAAACVDPQDTSCGQGGLWDIDPDERVNQLIAYAPGMSDAASGINVDNRYVRLYTTGLTINGHTVWNASVASVSTANVTYPNGKVAGVPLGSLSLGGGDTDGSDQYQFFTRNASRPGDGYSAWIFPGWLYNNSIIPSYSYGLHIGSAAFNYPGSLVFGGYNKGRVIAPVTAFSNETNIDLLDITIGVATGGTPFNFTRKDKLLSGGQTSVALDPRAPYMSLPRATCDSIVENLPISFDDTLKYYLWNTNDPNYARIVSSPAYLGFSFPQSDSGSGNLTIRVPFALLNLTLDKPITDTPRQYFPCVPYEGNSKLGRAFLQAAFIGRHWDTQTSWLAQAPGPGNTRRGLGDARTDIAATTTRIDGSTGNDLFAESWSNQLKALPGNDGDSQNGGGNGSGGNGGSSGGLSTGAKAGIGVGAAVGGLAVLAVGAFFLGRRRRNKTADNPYEHDANTHAAPYTDNKTPADHYAHQEPLPQQGWNHHTPVELPPNHAQPIELADSSAHGRPQH